MKPFSLEVKILNAKERLLSKIERIPFSGCWIWMGDSIVKGYGLLSVNGKCEYAHRASFSFHKGPIPEGMLVRHTCDIPLCVNPDHLVLGTKQDNANDMKSRGRSRNGEKNVNAKLNAALVEEIRSIHIKGHPEFGATALAARFDIGTTAAWKIVTNKTWK